MDAGGLLSRKAVLHRDRPQCVTPASRLECGGVEGLPVCSRLIISLQAHAKRRPAHTDGAVTTLSLLTNRFFSSSAFSAPPLRQQGRRLSRAAGDDSNRRETEEGINTAAVDPLALAMLGASASSGRAMTQPEKKLKKSVVLGTGEKGLVKENEKKKRMMAQNGRDSNVWKSEEEMILRQQFDS